MREEYFVLDNKATDISAMDEINNFDILKAVAEYIQVNANAPLVAGLNAIAGVMAGS